MAPAGLLSSQPEPCETESDGIWGDALPFRASGPARPRIDPRWSFPRAGPPNAPQWWPCASTRLRFRATAALPSAVAYATEACEESSHCEHCLAGARQFHLCAPSSGLHCTEPAIPASARMQPRAVAPIQHIPRYCRERSRRDRTEASRKSGAALVEIVPEFRVGRRGSGFVRYRAKLTRTWPHSAHGCWACRGAQGDV